MSSSPLKEPNLFFKHIELIKLKQSLREYRDNLNSIYKHIESKHVSLEEVISFIKVFYLSDTTSLKEDEIILKYNRQIIKYIQTKLDTILLEFSYYGYPIFSADVFKASLDEMKNSDTRTSNQESLSISSRLFHILLCQYIKSSIISNKIYMSNIEPLIGKNKLLLFDVFSKEELLTVSNKAFSNIAYCFIKDREKSTLKQTLLRFDFRETQDLEIIEKFILEPLTYRFAAMFLELYCNSPHYSLKFIENLLKQPGFWQVLKYKVDLQEPLKNKHFSSVLYEGIAKNEKYISFMRDYYDYAPRQAKIDFLKTLMNGMNLKDYFETSLNNKSRYYDKIGDIGLEVITPSQVAGYVSSGRNGNRHMEMFSTLNWALYYGKLRYDDDEKTFRNVARYFNSIIVRTFNNPTEENQANQYVVYYVPLEINSFQKKRIIDGIKSIIELNNKRGPNGNKIYGVIVYNNETITGNKELRTDTQYVDKSFLDLFESIPVSENVKSISWECSLEEELRQVEMEPETEETDSYNEEPVLEEQSRKIS